MIAYVFMWLLIIVLSVVFELHSPGLFFFLSFGFGAGLALLMELLAQPLALQVISFVIASVMAFVILRWYVALHGKVHQQYKSNIDALVGSKGVVTRLIGPRQSGSVKLGGELWTAHSQHQEVLAIGTVVEVVSIVGCHVIVKKSQ